MPSVTNQSKEVEASETKTLSRGYSILSPVEDKIKEGTWRQSDGDGLELSVIGNCGNHELIEEEMYLENLKFKLFFPILIWNLSCVKGQICSCHMFSDYLSRSFFVSVAQLS